MFLLNLLDLDLQHLHSSISLLWRALQRISARIRVIGGEAVHLLLIRFFFLFFLHKTGFVPRLVLIHAVLRDRAHSTQDIRASAGVQRAHGVLQLGRFADLRSLVQIGRPRRGGWSGSHGSIGVNQRVQWTRFIQRIRWVGANQRIQWVRFIQRVQWVRFVQWARSIQRIQWVRFVQWARFIQRIQWVIQVIQWVQIVRSTIQRFIDRIHIVRFSEAVAMIGHQSHFQVRFAFLGRAQLLLHVNQIPKKEERRAPHCVAAWPRSSLCSTWGPSWANPNRLGGKCPCWAANQQTNKQQTELSEPFRRVSSSLFFSESSLFLGVKQQHKAVTRCAENRSPLPAG